MIFISYSGMMKKIRIRYVQLHDAKSFLEILNDPKFYFWKYRPRNLIEETARIKKQAKNRKENIEWNYTILYDEKIIGVIGIKIYQHRRYCGEIGYIISTESQGKGMATRAVALLEKEVVKKLGLRRIEIITRLKNIASQKVALHNKYKKEGLMKKVFMMKDGSMQDAYLFAKTF